jgi:D-hexose-6-phosphate mutarotase
MIWPMHELLAEAHRADCRRDVERIWLARLATQRARPVTGGLPPAWPWPRLWRGRRRLSPPAQPAGEW